MLVLTSCSDGPDQPRLGKTVFEGPTDQSELVLPPTGSTMLGVNARNEVVLFDVKTGNITAQSASPLAKLTTVTDLVFDPYAQRALATRAQLDALPTGIESIPFAAEQPPRLGAPKLQLAASGPVRLMPVPAGLVMFEREQARWSFVATTDAAASSSIEAPPPNSLWAFVTASGSLQLNALSSNTVPHAALDWIQARVDSGISASTDAAHFDPIHAGWSYPRGIWLQRFGVPLVIGLADGTVSGVLLGEAQFEGWNRPRQLSGYVGAGHIEHVEALRDTAADVEHIAVLLSGPPRLVVIALGDRIRSNVVPLDGSLRRHRALFGRDVLVQGRRILIALRERVVALRWWPRSYEPPAIEHDERFDGSQLRGPLAGVVSLPE